MRIKDGFTVRQIAGDNVVIGESIELINFNKLIVLNSSALYIWENVIGKDFTQEDVVDLLCNHYNIDKETATADVKSLLEAWKENGLLC